MKSYIFLPALLLGCTVASAASEHTDNRQFLKAQLQADRQRFQALQSPGIAPQPRPVSPQEQGFITSQAQQFRQAMQPGERPVAEAMVFVSFSVPPAELKQRVKDAAELGIPVVIRGMVNGDMRATANAVAGLVKETNNGGVQIDPTAFRQYGITAVPVLIVTCDGKKVDRLQGDIVLRQALQRVAEEGDCARTARRLLKEPSQ